MAVVIEWQHSALNGKLWVIHCGNDRGVFDCDLFVIVGERTRHWFFSFVAILDRRFHETFIWSLVVFLSCCSRLLLWLAHSNVAA